MLLNALLLRCGVSAKTVENCRDDRQSLGDAIKRGMLHHVLIISGGVSVGEADYVVVLDRDSVSYVVSAAPPDALRPYNWCFPIAGCIPYIGYFSRADAEREGRRLRVSTPRLGAAHVMSGTAARLVLGGAGTILIAALIGPADKGVLATLIAVSGIASTVTGLGGCGQVYYVRAYATNSTGTGYGNQVTVSTGLVPALTTAPVTGIGYSTATSGGTIADGGGCAITQRGIVWGLSANPTTAGWKTTDGPGTDAFASSMTGRSFFEKRERT